jgi:hypothetical protein
MVDDGILDESIGTELHEDMVVSESHGSAALRRASKAIL